MDTIIIRDPLDSTVYLGEILATQELPQGAELLLVALPDIGKLSLIRWAGEIFSPTDWHGKQAHSRDDVELIEWMDASGTTAVLVNDLPCRFAG